MISPYSLRLSQQLVDILSSLTGICPINRVTFLTSHYKPSICLQKKLWGAFINRNTLFRFWFLQVGLRIGEWLTVVIVDVILIVVIYRYFRAAPTQPGTIQSISIRSRSSYPIIIVSVFSYTLTQFPNLIYRILQTASRPPYCSYNFTSKEDAAARPIVLMLFLTNYAINFILYCAVSAKFRAQLIKIKVRAIGGLVKLQKTRRGTLTTRVSMEESVPVETPLQQFGIHRGSSVRLIETEWDDNAWWVKQTIRRCFGINFALIVWFAEVHKMALGMFHLHLGNKQRQLATPKFMQQRLSAYLRHDWGINSNISFKRQPIYELLSHY